LLSTRRTGIAHRQYEGRGGIGPSQHGSAQHRQIANLAEAPNADENRAEAAGLLRSLIDRIELTPNPDAARGADIIQLADALGLDRPILGGFDWRGDASCVAAALRPERIGGLVSYAGYDVIDVGREPHPVPPSLERVFWYE
jgi:pimeloyl-ACP methyl ester carboxylesterase